MTPQLVIWIVVGTAPVAIGAACTRLMVQTESRPSAATEEPTEAKVSVTPPEARDLVETKGYFYLDVRTVEEFEAGRPTGAWNIPLVNRGPTGHLVQNDDFFIIVQKHFKKDDPIVVGCRTGNRSELAARLLRQSGHTNVYNMVGGFAGTRSPTGDDLPGWTQLGYPTESGPSDLTYEQLRK